MKYEATGSRRYACGERSGGKKREEKRRSESERKIKRETVERGRANKGDMRPLLLSSPLLSLLSPLSPRHIASVRSARSLTHSLRSLRRSRRSPSLSCRNPRPLSVPLSLYPVRCFPLFPFPRVHVRACTRVAASSSIGGRATQRAGYFSGWDI